MKYKGKLGSNRHYIWDEWVIEYMDDDMKIVSAWCLKCGATIVLDDVVPHRMFHHLQEAL